ncbi:hypothetical protein EVAR_51079_1 [Eumeta japonica]|uniref:Uncharacterized protein n=1 Tax=Eumeta variegata TaxID=151549 RepID=A0A4C1XPC7_EUMVA|nr:hypothetical protein EVAR_51079_1 [Eumeta japonica]
MVELSVKCPPVRRQPCVNRILASLTYELQAMVWQKKYESKINAVEMRSMRGMSSKDRCKNHDVRERCCLKEDVVTKVEKELSRKKTSMQAIRKYLVITTHGHSHPGKVTSMLSAL